MARKGKLCIRMAKLKQNKANISKKITKQKILERKNQKRRKSKTKKKRRRNSQRVVANAGNQRKAKVMKI